MPYLQGKLQRRFYEPLVLLLALTQACMHNHAPRAPDPLPDVPSHSPAELFKDFINKLCQICDNKQGGSAVTAISALQYPDRLQYRFASNQRSENDLLKVKSYLQSIVETLRDYTVASSLRVKASVLRQIVAFNRPRLQCYVRNLYSQTQICLETPGISPELSDKISELRDLALKADNRELEESKFFRNCTDLMIFIKILSKSPAYKSLQEKAVSNTGERSSWAELRHAAGRLLSYLQAANTLIEARKKWECLFHDFEVDYVRSSTLLSNPINDKKVTAEAIIGRMTGDATKMQAYRADAEELQKFDLDLKIKDQVTKSSFKPLVHAEVLVHQSILDESGPTGLRSSQFFNGYKYIGSSKPTCRLCDYYFTASASGIEVRETHRNLYVSWRAPDVYADQGEAAIKQRKQVIMKVLDRVREDTFRTLSEKVPERKQHDSNTDPTFPTWNPGTSVGFDGGGRDADLDDVAASMCQLDLRDSSGEAQEVRPESPSRASASGFDADDDEGGARLS
ncbi:hypothetical protein J7T55_006342 [Diaporthe amygdali]|uniref:uncharacterized protein n=1 Tax=Phomopsis amygdali TaxID=1214568 RepID=UPI0022FECA87|nr:uncharacterized protein J7T55_006342 [Diaporthe amygdali]KAJ0124999.1 hypothetical protein J7T55_006342 [Diaporthe amygdali]